jgi:hypothetical protein
MVERTHQLLVETGAGVVHVGPVRLFRAPRDVPVRVCAAVLTAPGRQGLGSQSLLRVSAYLSGLPNNKLYSEPGERFGCAPGTEGARTFAALESAAALEIQERGFAARTLGGEKVIFDTLPRGENLVQTSDRSSRSGTHGSGLEWSGRASARANDEGTQ